MLNENKNIFLIFQLSQNSTGMTAKTKRKMTKYYKEVNIET